MVSAVAVFGGGARLCCSTHIGFVCGESVVDTGRQNDEVVLAEMDANPPLILTPHVEITLAVADVADLLVFMQVLVEEGLDLVLVDRPHLLWRDKDLVSVLVASFFRQFVHAGDFRNAVV